MHPNLNLLENGHLKKKLVSGQEAITIRPVDGVASCCSLSICMFVFVDARERGIDRDREMRKRNEEEECV